VANRARRIRQMLMSIVGGLVVSTAASLAGPLAVGTVTAGAALLASPAEASAQTVRAHARRTTRRVARRTVRRRLYVLPAAYSTVAYGSTKYYVVDDAYYVAQVEEGETVYVETDPPPQAN